MTARRQLCPLCHQPITAGQATTREPIDIGSGVGLGPEVHEECPDARPPAPSPIHRLL